MTARIRLFLSSYVPLFVAGAIRFDHMAARVFLIVAAATGVVALASLIRVSVVRVRGRKATPTAVRDLGSEVAAYVATYLLPFVTVSEPSARDLAAYALVLVTLAIVFVNSDLVGVNPLLYVVGFRTYSVSGIRKDVHGRHVDAIVISPKTLRVGQRIDLVDLATGVSIALSRREK